MTELEKLEMLRLSGVTVYKPKPFCLTCSHKAKNENVMNKTITGTIDGKKRKRRMRPFEVWCLCGDMFEVNQNHMRWWGFDRRCPLNPYTHTCDVCGQRMCTSDTMCKSCARNRQFL